MCNCKDCNQPLDVQEQPRLRGGFFIMLTCRNKACLLQGVTLTDDTYETMTDEKWEAYREMNRRNTWRSQID